MEYNDTGFISEREELLDDETNIHNQSRLSTTQKLTMEKLDLLQTNLLQKSREFNATQSRLGGVDFAASTIIGADEQLETDVDTKINLRKSKNTLSRKSLKSIGVNEEDGKHMKVFNINQEDIEMLPNKSFYNTDGTKIKILGTINNTPHKRNQREAYAFSPLIQHLLRQRNAAQRLPGIGSLSSIGTFNNQGYKSHMSFAPSPNKKIEEKIVFMQVAGTMNVINSQKKRLKSQNGSRQFFNATPFAASTTQKFP
jgi:hypothetical protein